MVLQGEHTKDGMVVMLLREDAGAMGFEFYVMRTIKQRTTKQQNQTLSWTKHSKSNPFVRHFSVVCSFSPLLATLASAVSTSENRITISTGTHWLLGTPQTEGFLPKEAVIAHRVTQCLDSGPTF